MGGNESTSSYTQKLPLTEWKEQQGHTQRKVFQNKKDSTLWIEEYYVGLDDEELLSEITQMYQLRKNDNEIISSYHLRMDPKEELCSTSYRGELYLERIPITLSNITDIPFPDVLHVYHQALTGFQRLSRWAGHFELNEDCIGVNGKNVVKVWFHHEYDRPYPTNRIRSEQALVRNIIDLIEMNTDNRTLPAQAPSILNYIYQYSQNVGFSQARRMVQQYANSYNRGAIPPALGCAVSAGGAQNIRENWIQKRKTIDPLNDNSNGQVLYSPMPPTYQSSDDRMGNSAMNLVQSPAVEELQSNKMDSVRTPNFTLRPPAETLQPIVNVPSPRPVMNGNHMEMRNGRLSEGMNRRENMSKPTTHRFHPPMPMIRQEVVQQEMPIKTVQVQNRPPVINPLHLINQHQINTQINKQLPTPSQIQSKPQQVQHILPTVRQTPIEKPPVEVNNKQSMQRVVVSKIMQPTIQRRESMPPPVHHQGQLPPNGIKPTNWAGPKPLSVPLQPRMGPPPPATIQQPQVITRKEPSPPREQTKLYSLEQNQKSPLISHTDSPQRLAMQSQSGQSLNGQKVSEEGGNESMSSIVPSRTNKQYSDKMFSEIKQQSIHNSTRNFYQKYMGQDQSNLEWQADVQRNQIIDDIGRNENLGGFGKKNQAEGNGIGYSFGNEGTSSEFLSKLKNNQPIQYKYEAPNYQYSTTEKHYQVEQAPYKAEQYHPSYELEQAKEQPSNQEQYQYYEGQNYRYDSSPVADNQPYQQNNYQYNSQQQYEYHPQQQEKQEQYQYGTEEQYHYTSQQQPDQPQQYQYRKHEPMSQLQNLQMKYSVVQDPYNVEWDPEILADIQANVHQQ